MDNPFEQALKILGGATVEETATATDTADAAADGEPVNKGETIDGAGPEGAQKVYGDIFDQLSQVTVGHNSIYDRLSEIADRMDKVVKGQEQLLEVQRAIVLGSQASFAQVMKGLEQFGAERQGPKAAAAGNLRVLERPGEGKPQGVTPQDAERKIMDVIRKGTSEDERNSLAHAMSSLSAGADPAQVLASLGLGGAA